MPELQIRGPTTVLLGAVFVFGINSMFGQIYRNGYVENVVRLLSITGPESEAFLPGSHHPILTRYLGISPVDKLLTVGTVLWANVTDGSTPHLSLYALHFGGQLVPIFTVMIIESLRVGNAGTSLRFSILWGYMMQALGYAFTMPIYCCVHLFASSLSINQGTALGDSIRPRSLAPLSLNVLIPAFGLGYLLPTILMSYPFSSSTLHQWLGAAWQGFPLYVVALQHVLARLTTRAPTKSSQRDTQPDTRPWPQDRQTLSRAYDFAFSAAAVTQFLTFAVLGAAKFYPQAFPTTVAQNLSIKNVFVPGSFYSWKKMTSMAAAMHDFFLYDQYTGSAAAMIWAMAVYTGSTRPSLWTDWMTLGWDILRWCLAAGPGGAVIRLLQRRDEAILLKEEAVQKKRKAC